MIAAGRRMAKGAALLGLFAAGGLMGTALNGLLAPAPAVAHDCEQDECNPFFIFWERCEDNTGNNTSCEADADGCTTGVCGHA